MAFKSVKLNAKKLRDYVETSDKSVAMIATELGVSAGTVWGWLSNDDVAGVSPEVFQRMRAVLGDGASALKIGSERESDRTPTEHKWVDRLRRHARELSALAAEMEAAGIDRFIRVATKPVKLDGGPEQQAGPEGLAESKRKPK